MIRRAILSLLLVGCAVESDADVHVDKSKQLIVYAGRLDPEGQAIAEDAVRLFSGSSTVQAQTLVNGCAKCNPNIIILSLKGDNLQLVMPKHENQCGVLYVNGVKDSTAMANSLLEYVDK